MLNSIRLFFISSQIFYATSLQNALHFEGSTGDPHPSGHPHIFLENGTQTVKMQFDKFLQKIQKEAVAPVVCSINLRFDVEILFP